LGKVEANGKYPQNVRTKGEGLKKELKRVETEHLESIRAYDKILRLEKRQSRLNTGEEGEMRATSLHLAGAIWRQKGVSSIMLVSF